MRRLTKKWLLATLFTTFFIPTSLLLTPKNLSAEQVGTYSIYYDFKTDFIETHDKLENQVLDSADYDQGVNFIASHKKLPITKKADDNLTVKLDLFKGLPNRYGAYAELNTQSDKWPFNNSLTVKSDNNVTHGDAVYFSAVSNFTGKAITEEEPALSNNSLVVDGGHYGINTNFSTLFEEPTKDYGHLIRQNSLLMKNLTYGTSSTFYVTYFNAQNNGIFSTEDCSLSLIDINCDSAANATIACFMEKSRLGTVTGNSLSLTNCQTKNTTFNVSNLFNKDKVKDNTLIVIGNNNVGKAFGNFDHLTFKFTETTTLDSPFLDIKNVFSGNETTVTNLLNYKINVDTASMTPNLLNELVADPDKKVSLLSIAGSSTIANNEYFINDKSVSLDSKNILNYKVKNNLLTDGDYLLLTNTGKELQLLGGAVEVDDTPAFVQINSDGNVINATLDTKELELASEHNNYQNIYGLYNMNSSATEEELRNQAPDMRVKTNGLDLSNTCLYSSNENTLLGTFVVEAEGVKAKEVSGFANYDFKLKSEFDGKTMLTLTNKTNFDSEAKLNVSLDPDKASFNRIVLVKNVGDKPVHSYINDKESVLTISQDADHLIKFTTFAIDNEIADEIAVKETKKTYYAGEHIKGDKIIGSDGMVIDEKLVHDTSLENLNEMYGIYSDSSHATGERSTIGSGIDLNWITFKGGHSDNSACDDTTDNKIDFNGKGAKFNNVTNFQNINFNADSRTKDALSEANYSFLNTKEEVDLGEFTSELHGGAVEKRIVNFTADNFSLKKGEKLVLMNQVKNKANADFRFDGVKDMQTLYVGEVLENAANEYVLVTDITFDNSNENQVAVIGGNSDIHTGRFVDHKGKIVSVASGTLVIGDDSVPVNNRAALLGKAPLLKTDASGNEHIYGGYSVNQAIDATNTTIKLAGNVNKPNTLYHGGFNAARNEYVSTDNSLEVTGINNNVKGISHFANMHFVLPTDIKSGDTLLAVKDNVDLTPTSSIKVSATGYAVESLKGKDDSDKSDKFVNLLATEGTIQGYAEGKVTKDIELVSFTTLTASVDLSEDSKNLKLTLKTSEKPSDDPGVDPGDDPSVDPGKDPSDDQGGDSGDDGKKPTPAERTNNQTKAPVEAISAASALVDSSNDLVSGDLSRNMATLGKDGMNTFAAMSGGKTRYHSGSHIDSNVWNIGVGIGKKGLSKKNPNSTYGVFFNYGKSNFDTFNDGFVGNGKSKASGMGLMFHSEGKNNYYYNGSAFIGKVKAEWNSALGGYNDDATFRGFNLTMGHKHELKSNKVLDTYAKYLFSHTNAMNAKMGVYEYNFDAVESSRLRLGFRVECGKDSCKAKPFYGLAYEREFNGDAKASMNLGRVDSPSLKGDTGILEVGYKWTRGAWDFNFTVEGTCGKRQGVTGNFNAYYNF